VSRIRPEPVSRIRPEPVSRIRPELVISRVCAGQIRRTGRKSGRN